MKDSDLEYLRSLFSELKFWEGIDLAYRFANAKFGDVRNDVDGGKLWDEEYYRAIRFLREFQSGQI